MEVDNISGDGEINSLKLCYFIINKLILQKKVKFL